MVFPGDFPEMKVKVEEIEGDQILNPFTEVLILQQHSDIIRQLHPVGDKRCVSIGDDNLAVVWDIQLCLKLFVLSGHTRPITSLLLLRSNANYSDSDWLLTGSSDKTIKVWDLDTGKCLQTMTEHGASVKCLLSINDDLFLSAGQSLHLWSGAGKLLDCYHRTEKEIEDINLMIHVCGQTDRVVTASGKQIGVYQVNTTTDDVVIVTGDIAFVKNLPSHLEAIRSLTNLSDQCFASGSLDGTIVIWSCQTFLPTYKFNTVDSYQGKDHLYPYSIQHVLCLEERFLLAAIGSGFGLFDITTRKLICEKACAHFSKILHMTFVCDGAYLATCSEDGSIRLWGHAPHLNSSGTEDKSDMDLRPIERFLDISCDQLRHHKDVLPAPVLIGECLAHSGAVQMVVDCGLEGMLSCGVDGLVIAWKNAELQAMKRNQIIQEQFLNPSGIV
ncbi:WD repeat-containing protein 41 [Mizuhopecten yessoensis]|uniref:WD repeat-containing protein 41 n=1 Tax=Mizuhopecten yessoensis TaxID=6573 RepID=A0A210PRD0_MIZYE|nr:WD repeat-containing protein 41 [Mizuhopecten yessoensis]